MLKVDTVTRHCQQRRRFLVKAITCSAILAYRPGFAMTKDSVRELTFEHLHTGEKLNALYWENGVYDNEALQAINHVLRDHRTHEVETIDKSLLDVLFALCQQVGSKQPFQVISGYRSPKTNAMLHQNSNGVAKRSLHMQGRAIDVRLPRTELAVLHKTALTMQAGGVGYYQKSNFIHLDTGRVRYW